MIPKVIHYCWLSEDEIPANLQKCINTWQQHLSEYQFIKWDFTRFDKGSSIWVSEAFDNKKYAFACDYIRLFALYNYGGIYMDMDIEVLKDFDNLLNTQYMMAKERPDQNWIEAGCMGAEKNSPFIRKCLEYYENKHFVNKDGVFEDTPLPRIMSMVYDSNSFDFNLYDWHTFTNKSYETGEISTVPNSVAIHHFAGSWKNTEELNVENRALFMRRNIPLIGTFFAFIYIKGYKSYLALKNGGIKEFIVRVERYIKKS